MSPSAAVLAGGMSSRLGFPKALLRLGSGRTLIEDTVGKLRRLSDDVLVIANDPVFDVHGARRVADLVPGAASLGGIYTAVSAARRDRVIVVGCDMPFLSVALLAELAALEGDAIVPRIDGYPEPLHAVYSKACLPAIQRRIEAGQLKIAGFFADVDVRFVDEVERGSFRNVNTPAALREAMAAPEGAAGAWRAIGTFSAAPEGIEPPTPSLGRMRSIH
jgi:molybdopterin-guanine dinucleotide biosynthesis protein A